ncbi:hypothetical protein [Nocardioides marmoribigeumensis]|uniref:Protein-tyrosine-phosphatase n=1 Tax=Nocardioides marmoribigeumensis TaxID=433649 RepID=A0ABU2BQ71_9ACTN|nr:hypothetical protein [Nocardioides marmoribigeumensis]MDR7360782.1 protein-tyrosine-phosphatase [Nocardioides marmoribigeumensis]
MTRPTVLFVCVHNAGRSQMAAASPKVLDDPAGQGLEAVRPIRDEIRRRVEDLVASLEG